MVTGSTVSIKRVGSAVSNVRTSSRQIGNLTRRHEFTLHHSGKGAVDDAQCLGDHGLVAGVDALISHW